MRIINIVIKYLAFIVILTSILGCDKHSASLNSKEFKYPKSKIWAHKVNDTLVAQAKKELFAGLEVDLIYSEYQNQLIVGHNDCDTIYKLTFEQWLSSLSKHSDCCYWLDIKNLSEKNADSVASIVSALINKFKINKNQIMIEHTDCNALVTIKNNGLFVLLWIYEYPEATKQDTALWIENAKEMAAKLEPDAISAHIDMHPLLSNTFPGRNIHYWNTPIKNYESNLVLTEELCKVSNVKVVLVDYDVPLPLTAKTN